MLIAKAPVRDCDVLFLTFVPAQVPTEPCVIAGQSRDIAAADYGKVEPAAAIILRADACPSADKPRGQRGRGNDGRGGGRGEIDCATDVPRQAIDRERRGLTGGSHCYICCSRSDRERADVVAGRCPRIAKKA